MSGGDTYNPAIVKAYKDFGADLCLTPEQFAAMRLDFTSQHLADLALARACAAGHEAAWKRLLDLYQQRLQTFALSLTREPGAACELADSLYASLYSSREKLLSYSGRGPLEGWLRAVLAQEHVNRIRQQRRFVPLQEEPGAVITTKQDGQDCDLLSRAVHKAFASINAEQAFLLSAYFLDNRTLAEIGRILGLHESSVSRRLEKSTQTLRKRILKALENAGLPRRAAEEMLKVDVRELHLDVRAHLTQERKQDAFL